MEDDEFLIVILDEESSAIACVKLKPANKRKIIFFMNAPYNLGQICSLAGVAVQVNKVSSQVMIISSVGFPLIVLMISGEGGTAVCTTGVPVVSAAVMQHDETSPGLSAVGEPTIWVI